MHVMLTKTQWESLFYWGVEHGCDGADESASLLLKVLLQTTGEPPPLAELPPRIKGRVKGSVKYYARVTICPLTQDARVRALWAWGSTLGCGTIAEAMRQLVDLMVIAYPGLGPGITKPEKPRLECLYALADRIENPRQQTPESP